MCCWLSVSPCVCRLLYLWRRSGIIEGRRFNSMVVRLLRLSARYLQARTRAHTHTPLSPSSIVWYLSKDSDTLRIATEKVTSNLRECHSRLSPGHTAYGAGRRCTRVDVRPRELDLCVILRPSTYGDAVCVNAATEINVLDYNVAVRQHTSRYGGVRRRT